MRTSRVFRPSVSSPCCSADRGVRWGVLAAPVAIAPSFAPSFAVALALAFALVFGGVEGRSLAAPGPEDSPAIPEQKPAESTAPPAPSPEEGAAASKDAAETGEKRDEGEESKRKLSDRIKSVERKVFLKKNRIELFPQFAFDLNDAIQKHFFVGAAVAYHLADTAAIELRGNFVVATQRQSIVHFIRQANGALPANPFEAKYSADVDFLWAPIYGKISLFSEAILHFDTYLTAGPGVFGTDGGLGPAVNVGIGQRYFITDWLVARIELRDYIFQYTQDLTNTSSIENLLVLGFAVSGFFPTEFQYEYQ